MLSRRLRPRKVGMFSVRSLDYSSCWNRYKKGVVQQLLLPNGLWRVSVATTNSPISLLSFKPVLDFFSSFTHSDLSQFTIPFAYLGGDVKKARQLDRLPLRITCNGLGLLHQRCCGNSTANGFGEIRQNIAAVMLDVAMVRPRSSSPPPMNPRRPYTNYSEAFDESWL